MHRPHLVLLLSIGCSGASTTGTSGPPPGDQQYFSDCSLTHPVAQDPCAGPGAETRGLASCASLGVTPGRACGEAAPGCYVEGACSDGRTVVVDYLVCAP